MTEKDTFCMLSQLKREQKRAFAQKSRPRRNTDSEAMGRAQNYKLLIINYLID